MFLHPVIRKEGGDRKSYKMESATGAVTVVTAQQVNSEGGSSIGSAGPEDIQPNDPG